MVELDPNVDDVDALEKTDEKEERGEGRGNGTIEAGENVSMRPNGEEEEDTLVWKFSKIFSKNKYFKKQSLESKKSCASQLEPFLPQMMRLSPPFHVWNLSCSNG